MAAERKTSTPAPSAPENGLAPEAEQTAQPAPPEGAAGPQGPEDGAPPAPPEDQPPAPPAPAGEPVYVVGPNQSVYGAAGGVVEAGQRITPEHFTDRDWFDELVNRGTIVRRS